MTEHDLNAEAYGTNADQNHKSLGGGTWDYGRFCICVWLRGYGKA